MELSTEPAIDIPGELLDLYGEFRPTPLFEARRFAETIGTDCRIYVKDEGTTPSGNHKANSALWIAYHCALDGVGTIATETTGNWGVALAQAAARFDLDVLCFLDTASAAARPDRAAMMRDAGAEVVVVGEEGGGDFDPLVLSANAAIDHVRAMKDVWYIFGSVYNYFILPQTLVGQEALAQLGGDAPDVVVGSCGGGANLLGIAAPFLGRPGVEVVCAESEHCPIVSAGVFGEYSIDDRDFYPRLRTYGLERLLGSEYIGGLGSTIVAAPVAHFHRQGQLATRTFTADDAGKAARIFAESEGRTVALETGYQLAAVIAEARSRSRERILVNISSTGHSRFA
ncbi:pyridoxal-phosphate dependent enzyme [Streptomyces sp. NPDC050704]|uniref:pyridoxal-phosphate dependent enzyme n=1 Tax=Streptomyces sp. NPDC050704 TaxID=3157219 RepID=UPI003422DF38